MVNAEQNGDKHTKESKKASTFKPPTAEKEIELQYDLGNLACFDIAPVNQEEFRSNPDQHLLLHARDCAQLLINKLFDLPTKSADVGRVAQLPPSTSIVPREKPIPKPKALTKWQKFAQSKGIVKRKRGRMEFDDASGEWKPRYGYKRADNPNDNWVVEAKPGDDPNEDPFDSAAKDRKTKRLKQEKQQLRNLREAASSGAPQLPVPLPAVGAVASRPAAGKPAPQRPSKSALDTALQIAQRSSASAGKFDQAVENEPDKDRGKKRKFEAVASKDGAAHEKNRVLAVLNKVLGPEEEMDVQQAASRYVSAQQRAKKEEKGADKSYREQLKAQKKKARGKSGGLVSKSKYNKKHGGGKDS